MSQSVDNSDLAHFVSEHKIPRIAEMIPQFTYHQMAGILSDYFWWDFKFELEETAIGLSGWKSVVNIFLYFSYFYLYLYIYFICICTCILGEISNLYWKKRSLVSLCGNLSSRYLVELGITIYAEQLIELWID